MLQSRPIKKLVWAVDPFEGESLARQRSQALIEVLARQLSIIVETVFVLALEREENTPNTLQAAHRALDSFANQLRPALPLSAPHVLLCRFPGTGERVDSLSHYALKESNADLIVVGTHARSGVSRLFLGSFAETLIARSGIPVLIIGPDSHVPSEGIQSMLFPSDLGEHAQEAYEAVVNLAAQLNSSLTLYHAVSNPVEPVISSGMFLLGGSWVPVSPYFSDEYGFQRERIRKWTERANQRGVRTRFHVDSRGGSRAASILNYCARKGHHMILMEARSGPFVSALIGSVTRQVIRNASCPVWVFRQ